MVLRRGFSLAPGERALITEDVVTTGLSTKEVMDVVRAAGGVVAAVGSIIDRSGADPAFGVPFMSLAKVAVATYQPDACPLCRANVPVVKPGSRGK